MQQKSSSETNARDAIMFCVSPAFGRLLAGEEGKVDKAEWVDMMLACISKSFTVDRSMRECKDNLVTELLKEKQVNFLTKVRAI